LQDNYIVRIRKEARSNYKIPAGLWADDVQEHNNSAALEKREKLAARARPSRATPRPSLTTTASLTFQSPLPPAAAAAAAAAEMSVWNYVVTAHKPTSVSHSCVGNFTSPNQLNLIVA
jgi:hypothetical protein